MSFGIQSEEHWRSFLAEVESHMLPSAAASPHYETGLDVWKATIWNITVLVPPHYMHAVHKVVKKQLIPHSVLVEDVSR
jgi:hypothetical protein